MDKSKSRVEYCYLRSTIQTEEEADNFVKLFSGKTNTNWIPHDLHQRPKQVHEKYIFYKTWLCYRTWQKKEKFAFRNDHCKAKITIFLKTRCKQE
ncbi:uncharacterized protein CEXT_598701 [Caerostris extrusa]|uniref:Uncharacterized protein n=1 Tax=Caerostris extrusa TaxID=172846 RepID=A0AAV4URV0_CAEEX|nr:uncharacterized protein CEXT_598701 [Caerostris extrusa]